MTDEQTGQVIDQLTGLPVDDKEGWTACNPVMCKDGKITDEGVRKLCQSGRVCEVVGHKRGTGWYNFQTGDHIDICSVCGRKQTNGKGPWQDVSD